MVQGGWSGESTLSRPALTCNLFPEVPAPLPHSPAQKAHRGQDAVWWVVQGSPGPDPTGDEPPFSTSLV